MGSFSIWHWLIVLLVVVLIFGTKKLRNIGSDVGGAVKNFKEAMTTEQGQAEANGAGGADHRVMASNLIEAEVSEMPVVKAAPKKRAPAKPAVKKAAASETTVKPKAPRKPSATTAKIK